jgi:SAM-dependent methyltransferase
MGSEPLQANVDSPLVQAISACRSCGGRELVGLLDLGASPLADRLQDQNEPAELAPRAPLELVLCPACGLVQLRHTVSRALLFDDRYPYLSSSSPALLAHARALAADLEERNVVNPGGLVLELASNDGYLLRNFSGRGMRVLGVDPAAQPVSRARDAGIPTLQAFFGTTVAERVLEQHGAADVIVANNVLAHVDDLNDVVQGMKLLLTPGGVISVEVPYLGDMIERCEFDTIYHQHLCYFSLQSLDALFRRHGLAVSAAQRLEIHGGSLRLTVTHAQRDSAPVAGLLAAEREAGMATAAYFDAFAGRVQRVRDKLRALLGTVTGRGERVAAYGAAAKGTTLLHYCDIDESMIDFAVDRNAFKHGRRMPGTGIPIEPVDRLLERGPAYALLLAWNFADEILAQQVAYRRQGGRFIVPIPEPAIL